MSKIYKNVTEFIGNTPLMEICHIEEKEKLKGRVLVKLEYLNPAGSVKDRAAKSMLEDAQRRGVLKAGSVIIEPTSGNTGIGLASIAAVLGYRMILTMPETMSQERINILKAYGAEIVLTDGKKGMQGAVDKAEELAEEIPDSFIPGQFENPASSRGDHGAGDLGGHPRKRGLFCGWSRYWRHVDWYRRIFKEQEFQNPSDRRRTCGFPFAF